MRENLFLRCKRRFFFRSVFRNCLKFEYLQVAQVYKTGGAGRLAIFKEKKAINFVDQISVYPNPASNYITIESSLENIDLEIKIQDLSGRLVMEKRIKLSGFIANLDLILINGAYIICITNINHEKISKKLLIAK